MFGHFSEQMKNSSKPASELLTANVKAVEAMTKQQTQFFSGLVDDSVKLMQTIAQQTELNDVLAAQAVYAESLMERLTSTSVIAYEAISSVSQQYSDALNSGFATAGQAAKETVKTATAKTAPLKAASAKKANVKTAALSTATTTKAKPTSKVITKKPDKKMAIQKQPAPKPAEKPVVMLSAEEVKAPAETKTTDVTAAPDNTSLPETKA